MEQQIVDYKETLAKQNEDRLRTAVKEIEERIIAAIDDRIRAIVREEMSKNG
jgi:hypothetical protein